MRPRRSCPKRLLSSIAGNSIGSGWGWRNREDSAIGEIERTLGTSDRSHVSCLVFFCFFFFFYLVNFSLKYHDKEKEKERKLNSVEQIDS